MQCKVSVSNFLQIDAVVQAADISKLFSFSRKRRHASISQTVFESLCIFLYKRESNVPNFEEICLLVQAALAAKISLHLQSPLTTNTPRCNPFVKCRAYFLGYVQLVCQILSRSIRQFRLQISPNFFLLVVRGDRPAHHKPVLGGRASPLTKGKEVCEILEIQA